MWSILYECEGVIHQIGPYQNEQAAMNAFFHAVNQQEFSIYDQRVYLLTSDHQMIELGESDLD